MCYPGEGEGYFAVYCPPGGSPAKLAMPPNAGPKGAKAYAVNDSGVVVGFSYQGTSGSQEVGCIWWPNGTVQEIPPAPGATSSAARAINNAGFVTGMSGGKAYIWKDGAMTQLPAGGGTTHDISDAGHVVGFMVTAGEKRAFRWKEGVLDVLPPVDGYEESGAFAANSAGVVVGYSQTFLGFGFASMPTIWIENKPMALPLPPGYIRGGARSINDAGVIVGNVRISYSSGSTTPVVWIGGGAHLLNSLVVPGSPTPDELIALNESGQILSGGSARIATPMSASPADLNGDCAVDGSDLMKLLSEWGPRDFSVADLNHDGIVNGADLAQVLGNWTGSK